MAFKLHSDVRETSTTGGTGDQVLTGAAFDPSYFRFNDRYANADTFFYCMRQGGLREVGLGSRVASGDKIVRTQVYKSTNANALVNFNAGQTVDIFVTNVAPDDLDPQGRLLLNTVSGAVSSDPGQTDAQKLAARGAIYAAPLDAMSSLNMAVNGQATIDQQYSYGTLTLPAGSLNTYVCDNWTVAKTGTSVLTSQGVLTGMVGAPFARRLTVTTAQASMTSDLALFRTYIPGYKFRQAQWGTVNATPITCTLWMKFPVAGPQSATIYNIDSSANSGASFTIATANVYQLVTVVFPAVTTGTWRSDYELGGQISFFFAGGAAPNCVGTVGNIIEWTGLAILPGIFAITAEALPRLLRGDAAELNDCRELFWAITDAPLKGVVTVTGVLAGRMTMQLPRPMRVAPTASFAGTNTVYDGGGTASATSIAASYNTRDYVQLDLNLSASLVSRAPAILIANAAGTLFLNSRY